MMRLAIINKDLYRYAGNIKGKSFLRFFYGSPGFRFTVFFRLLQIYKNNTFLRMILWPFYKRYYRKYGFQIPISVIIGKGVYFPHFGNIVVNSGAEIGDNCNILQGVTIGNVQKGGLKGNPIIGNNVYIGPNAIIVGKIVVGNNVLIAPGTFVNFNVPDDSLVIGNPGIIKPKKDATDGYLKNTSHE